MDRQELDKTNTYIQQPFVPGQSLGAIVVKSEWGTVMEASEMRTSFDDVRSKTEELGDNPFQQRHIERLQATDMRKTQALERISSLVQRWILDQKRNPCRRSCGRNRVRKKGPCKACRDMKMMLEMSTVIHDSQFRVHEEGSQAVMDGG